MSTARLHTQRERMLVHPGIPLSPSPMYNSFTQLISCRLYITHPLDWVRLSASFFFLYISSIVFSYLGFFFCEFRDRLTGLLRTACFCLFLHILTIELFRSLVLGSPVVLDTLHSRPVRRGSVVSSKSKKKSFSPERRSFSPVVLLFIRPFRAHPLHHLMSPQTPHHSLRLSFDSRHLNTLFTL